MQFKASARALDMLGRQQIAGRPTAISELSKNAHDAYAAPLLFAKAFGRHSIKHVRSVERCNG